MKDKFTLKDALIIVKNHLLFSILIFSISLYGVQYLDFFPKKFKSVHTISLSKIITQDVALNIHDKSKIVNLIGSTDFRNKLLNKISEEDISIFYVDKHEQSKNLVSLIYKGNSADSIFNTATLVMDYLVEMDMNAIDIWEEKVAIQKENNLKLLKDLQLSENFLQLSGKSFSNNLPQDKIEHYSKMQNSYNDLLEIQLDSTNADLSNNVASIVRLENDIVSLRIATKNKILSTKEAINELNLKINELNFASNSVKIISYLIPPSKQSASLYFPNTLVYLGCALIIMLFYNLIVLSYYIRKYMK